MKPKLVHYQLEAGRMVPEKLNAVLFIFGALSNGEEAYAEIMCGVDWIGRKLTENEWEFIQAAHDISSQLNDMSFLDVAFDDEVMAAHSLLSESVEMFGESDGEGVAAAKMALLASQIAKLQSRANMFRAKNGKAAPERETAIKAIAEFDWKVGKGVAKMTAYRQIAKDLGINQGTVRRYLKQRDKYENSVSPVEVRFWKMLDECAHSDARTPSEES